MIRQLSKTPHGEIVALTVDRKIVVSNLDGKLELNREKMNRCMASRKGDREVLAGVLAIIAKRHGAEIERQHTPRNPGYSGAGIDMHFELNGVGARTSIDNLHGGNYALISWFNSKYPARNFTTRFSVCVGDLPNSRPHHKATSCPADWFSLAMLLDGGLMLAARDQAFEPFDL